MSEFYTTYSSWQIFKLYCCYDITSSSSTLSSSSLTSSYSRVISWRYAVIKFEEWSVVKWSGKTAAKSHKIDTAVTRSKSEDDLKAMLNGQCYALKCITLSEENVYDLFIANIEEEVAEIRKKIFSKT